MRSIVVNDGRTTPARATRRVGVTLAMVTLLAMGSTALAQSLAWPKPELRFAAGQEASVTGPIVSRQGDDMLVREETTRRLSVVTLRPDTRIIEWTGFLNLEKRARAAATLIPGLVVIVRGYGGSGGQGNLEAEAVSFRSGSFQTASQINAGELELKAEQRQTAALAAANRDSLVAAYARAQDSIEVLNARLSMLDSYDVKLATTITFAKGSSALSEQAKATLDVVAAKSHGLYGYLIEVAGYADNTGSPDINQRLSTARADAVVAYLAQAHSVPLRRIVNPTGLGASHPAASNDSEEGRAQNRRAVVKVMVNRGLRSMTER
jgi:outer membrane protein OmpA-like peptidoglycan-associated protein